MKVSYSEMMETPMWVIQKDLAIIDLENTYKNKAQQAQQEKIK